MADRGEGSGGSGRTDEQRRQERAERDAARAAGRRPPPDFGPSTRAARDRKAGPPRDTRPAPLAPRPSDPAFEFARPSTRAAGAGAPAAERRTPDTGTPEAGTPDWDAPVAATAAGPAAAPARPASFEPLEAAAAPSTPRPARAPRAARARRGPQKPRTPRSRPALPDVPRSAVAGAVAVACGVLLLLGVALAAGLGSGDGERDGGAAGAAAEAKGPVSPYGEPTDTPLPPGTRIVAYTGAPQAKELGILGTMPFERASDRLDRQAVPYDRKTRPVLRAFDLIATIADADPGPAGKYRTRQRVGVIGRYLRAARRHDAALILDVQPGTSNFVDELRPLERWLKEPDVHLALDPEWRMRPGVQPGTEIGWVSAGEITATLNRVARIVRANDLPPKLVLVHRFTDGMIRDLGQVDVPKEVVGVISVDGVGTRAQKRATYDRIAPTLPKPWLPGFKLFYVEDKAAGGLMSGKQVMAMEPRPHVVLYE